MLRPGLVGGDEGRQAMAPLLRETARALQLGATAVRFATELANRIPRREPETPVREESPQDWERELEQALLLRIASGLVPSELSWLSVDLPTDQLGRDNLLQNPIKLFQSGLWAVVLLGTLVSLLLLLRAFWPIRTD